MQHSDFVHLHVHTQYSLLDGAIRLNDLFEAARNFKMPAVAITDHGNMFGAIDFYQKALNYGIKPIIGCELYVTMGSRFDRGTSDSGDTPRHLVVLARNMEGYRNLMKLTSSGYLEGFYYRPRVDKQLLAECSGGLIGMSACLNGEVASCILSGNRSGAERAAAEYRDIFGEGNFYLELMENGLPEQKEANEGLVEVGRKLNIPLVATNDCHYLRRENAEAHEILLCIQTGKTIDDPNRMRFKTDQFYFKSPEEMKQNFSYAPEAIENTIAISERCNLTLDFDQIFLPHFELDEDVSTEEYLREHARHGLERLFSSIAGGDNSEVQERYRKRLESELDIIESMGFPGYFLIVADFVDYAKRNSIPVGPGRGSAAGSLVAWALGITTIDPIRYGLFFERFLNPDRRSMPDIDIDFCIEGRDAIIDYVTGKYGAERVSQIITFGKMQAKAVVRDVGRALNMPYGEVDRIAKLIPNVLNITLDDAVKRESRLREEIDKNPAIKKLIDMSKSLEGLTRHASTHAAGVVISDVPLVERVPLFKSPRNDDVVTQYSMNDLQRVGLTKFDFLGLKTLTVIERTLRFIEKGRGDKIDFDEIPLDDSNTYQLLMKGQTDGVFQLESSGMKDILVSMKPDRIEDLIALIALYRPGPMNMVPDFIARKQGRQKISYEVGQLENILKETYGVILYQEQVMQIASTIGNYTMAEADNLRRVMSKKKVSDMEREKPKFLEGAKKNKINEARAKKIWEQMETFAEYGFNKSHSTAYAFISFQTAYLKAHYPVEFMAALLTSEKNNRDNIIKYISECRDMGIPVLPPDVNESEKDFSVTPDQSIRFGLAAVKNVGEGAVDAIIEARNESGTGELFPSFYDFCTRTDFRKVNKKVVESLIKCGAFDSLEPNRRRLIEGYETIVDLAQKRKKDRMSGQKSLFDQPDMMEEAEPSLPDIPEWDQDELLAHEKDTLGFYVSGHPLLKYSDMLALVASATSETLGSLSDGSPVSVCGVVSGVREVSTRKKETMAYVTLDDMKGIIPVILFPEVYRAIYGLIAGDMPIHVKGTVDAGEEGTKILATEVVPLEEAVKNPVGSVHFTINLSNIEQNLDVLKKILEKHRGNCPAYLHLNGDNHAETIIYLGDKSRVVLSDSIRADVDRILGSGSTVFI
ncbi:MAG: DNA polymerase III subunit alpha [delta proteobacterium MLS_D]|jgi:DNA polymerase III subunit alpha|nr:MAG: DNA polymerase III subunit alpha [delta proteobacterium MLS_D]